MADLGRWGTCRSLGRSPCTYDKQGRCSGDSAVPVLKQWRHNDEIPISKKKKQCVTKEVITLQAACYVIPSPACHESSCSPLLSQRQVLAASHSFPSCTLYAHLPSPISTTQPAPIVYNESPDTSVRAANTSRGTVSSYHCAATAVLFSCTPCVRSSWITHEHGKYAYLQLIDHGPIRLLMHRITCKRCSAT